MAGAKNLVEHLPVDRSAEPRKRVAAADCDEVARERFGVELHSWQRDATMAVLEGDGNVLVIAPTGGGKSLTYQLPATMLDGVTLVVCPLISLMEDQVRGLEKRGIRATFLASSIDSDERSRRKAAIRRGEIDLVYVAPEGLNDGIASLVEGRLALVAVDEAHCVVQWGHDFRPDYLRIGTFIERERPRRVLACTATATPDTRDEIVRALGMPKERTHVFMRGFARPNLALEVVEVEGRTEARAVTEKSLGDALGTGRSKSGAGIVYAGTRRNTEALGLHLEKRGFKAKAYHAGMEAGHRTRVASAFASGEANVIVATNAFGMGIDRSDVRLVVHAQPPGSIEAYYQEVGRAGRDGAPARGVLCIAPADIGLRRRLIEMGSNGEAADPREVARAWKLFCDLLRFVDARSCRHDFILRYFGDEAESLGGCKRCDICGQAKGPHRDESAAAADLLAVRKILAGVARSRERAGSVAVAQMLAGSASEKVRRFGLADLSTFGVLSDLGETEVLRALRACTAAGYVNLTPTDHPVPYVTPLGKRVMMCESPNEVVLGRPKPAAGERVRARKPKRGAASASATADLSGEVGERFERLRKARSELARSLDYPAYVVASNAALVALATAAPKSLEAMLAVPGWGAAKVDRYGAQMLDALRDG